MKHYAIKTYGEMEVWVHHSWPCQWMEVNGQIHGPAALPPEIEFPVPIG
jgi:hypothetical protein